MHCTLLVLTTLSLFSTLALAAPTFSPSTSGSTPTPSTAHLPGVPHAPDLHPSQSSQSSQPSQVPNVQARNAAHLEKRNLGMERLKELMVEIRRDGDGSGKEEGQKKGNDGNGDHATYMLGSPVSFPARRGRR